MSKVSKLGLTAIFVEDDIQGGYTAYFMEYPNVLAEGNDKLEALENLFRIFIISRKIKDENNSDF